MAYYVILCYVMLCYIKIRYLAWCGLSKVSPIYAFLKVSSRRGESPSVTGRLGYGAKRSPQYRKTLMELELELKLNFESEFEFEFGFPRRDDGRDGLPQPREEPSNLSPCCVG